MRIDTPHEALGHGTDIERGMPLDGGVVEGGWQRRREEGCHTSITDVGEADEGTHGIPGTRTALGETAKEDRTTQARAEEAATHQ